MALGSRAQHMGPGYGGIPATLHGDPALDPTGSYPGAGGCACSQGPTWRKQKITSQLQTATIGGTMQIARLTGPQPGQIWTIERLTAEVFAGSDIFVGAGPVGTNDYTYSDSQCVAPTSYIVTLTDPAPIRLLPGEDLSVTWPAATNPMWARLTIREERV